MSIIAQHVIPFWNQEATCNSLVERKNDLLFLQKKNFHFYTVIYKSKSALDRSYFYHSDWSNCFYLISIGSSNEKIVTHIDIVKTCHYPHPLVRDEGACPFFHYFSFLSFLFLPYFPSLSFHSLSLLLNLQVQSSAHYWDSRTNTYFTTWRIHFVDLYTSGTYIQQTLA